MVLSIVLVLDEVSDTSVRYVEKTGGKPPIIGTLDIERWALPQPVPSEMRLTLEFPREAHPIAEGTGAAISERPAPSKASLSTGDRVAVVKNTVAGAKYPPEWLAQYLGKTGVVLWTTHDGAMVQLARGATWFPYEEMEAKD